MSVASLFSSEKESDKKLFDPYTGQEIDLQRPPMYYLMLTAEEGGLSLLKECIRGGINVNHYDPYNGISLLFHLIDHLYEYSREEAEEALDLMIEYSVDLKHTDNDENTALHRVAQYKGTVWCLEKLIVAGADINAQNKAGEFPLCKTVKREPSYEFNEEAARILIQRGAGSAAINKSLFTAARRRLLYERDVTPEEMDEQKTAVAFFLYHGADHETEDRFGSKPYHYTNGNPDIKSMLESAEAVKQSIEWFKESRLWTVD